MIASAARPYFCPHPGYFARVLASDVFVVLDEVQFPRGSTWITRNRFKDDQGELWISVPVWKKGLGLQRISEVKVCREGRWAGKHLASLRQAYLHAPYRDAHMGLFERLFSPEREGILDMNLEALTYVLGALGCPTRIVGMSELGIREQGTRLLVEICRALGASHYLISDSAGRWVEKDLFAQAGIEVLSLRSNSPVYPQLWGPFIPDLSIFDLLFTCGPKAREIIAGDAGTRGKIR